MMSLNKATVSTVFSIYIKKNLTCVIIELNQDRKSYWDTLIFKSASIKLHKDITDTKPVRMIANVDGRYP